MTIEETCYAQSLLNSNEWFVNPENPVASFTKEVTSWVDKCPSVFSGRLAIRGLTSLVKEATDVQLTFLHVKCRFCCDSWCYDDSEDIEFVYHDGNDNQTKMRWSLGLILL